MICILQLLERIWSAHLVQLVLPEKRMRLLVEMVNWSSLCIHLCPHA